MAMRACVDAAVQCGLSIGGQTASSMVLLPGVRRSLLRCLAPSAAAALATKSPAGSGCGIAAELTSRGGDGLAISIVSPEADTGSAYIEALREQLSHIAPAAKREAAECQSPLRRESSAYLLVSKLLCDRKELPGAFAAEFVQGFAERYSPESAAARAATASVACAADRAARGPPASGAAMAECMDAVAKLRALVEQAVGGMGLSCPVLPEEVGPLLRRTVERCLFARVGPTLWRHYSSHHRERDDRYAHKARALSRLSDFELLRALEVKPVFCGGGSSGPSGAKTCGSPRARAEAPAPPSPSKPPGGLQDSGACGGETGGTGESPPLTQRDVSLVAHPYERASAVLQQVEASLQRGGTPSGATEALLSAQLEMKACAFEASGGEAELTSMDDILPLFVFILARSPLRRPLACAALLRDALPRELRIDSEGRATLLLESAAAYVADEWDFSELLATDRGGSP